MGPMDTMESASTFPDTCQGLQKMGRAYIRQSLLLAILIQRNAVAIGATVATGGLIRRDDHAPKKARP